MTSSIENYFFDNFKFFVLIVNQYADLENYAIVIARIKISKKNEKRKVWLRCDRENKSSTLREQKRVYENFKLQECLFKMIAKKFENFVDGILTVENFSHNHFSTLTESHSALRKLALTKKIVDVIKIQSRIDIASVKINISLRFDTDEKNPMFNPQNIYNAKTNLKRR